jgi:hypothetical protein
LKSYTIIINNKPKKHNGGNVNKLLITMWITYGKGLTKRKLLGGEKLWKRLTTVNIKKGKRTKRNSAKKQTAFKG